MPPPNQQVPNHIYKIILQARKQKNIPFDIKITQPEINAASQEFQKRQQALGLDPDKPDPIPKLREAHRRLIRKRLARDPNTDPVNIAEAERWHAKNPLEAIALPARVTSSAALYGLERANPFWEGPIERGIRRQRMLSPSGGIGAMGVMEQAGTARYPRFVRGATEAVLDPLNLVAMPFIEKPIRAGLGLALRGARALPGFLGRGGRALPAEQLIRGAEPETPTYYPRRASPAQEQLIPMREPDLGRTMFPQRVAEEVPVERIAEEGPVIERGGGVRSLPRTAYEARTGRQYPGPQPGVTNRMRLVRGEKFARGKQALKNRIDLEYRVMKSLDPVTRYAADEFLDMLPDHMVEDLGSSYITRISDRDVGRRARIGLATPVGTYEPDIALINIFKRLSTGEVAGTERVIVHEVAHHLEQFVPSAEARKLVSQFRKEMSDRGQSIIDEVTELRKNKAAEARDVEARELAKREGYLTPEQLALPQEVKPLTDIEEKLVRDSYRYTNFQEWFAEVIADKALRDILMEIPEKRNVIQRVLDAIKELAINAYRTLLRRGATPDEAERVYKNLINNEFDPAKRRSLLPDEGMLEEVPDLSVPAREQIDQAARGPASQFEVEQRMKKILDTSLIEKRTGFDPERTTRPERLWPTPRLGDAPDIRVKSLKIDTARKEEVKELAREGLDIGGRLFYETEPFRDVFVAKHGEVEGDRQFKQYMGFLAATSPGTKVEPNVRIASNFRKIAQEIEDGVPLSPDNEKIVDFIARVNLTAEGKGVPKGYGHKMRNTHAKGVINWMAGKWDDPDNLNSLKTRSFSEAFLGHRTAVPIDMHVMRVLGMTARDKVPWLDASYQAISAENLRKLADISPGLGGRKFKYGRGPTNKAGNPQDFAIEGREETAGLSRLKDHLRVNSKGEIEFNALEAVEAYRTTKKKSGADIEDIKGMASVYKQGASASEYGPMENFFGEIATELTSELGEPLLPYQVQGAVWYAAASRTGVKSEGTLIENISKRIKAQAKARNVPEIQVFHEFLNGKGIPGDPLGGLLSIMAGIAGAREVLNFEEGEPVATGAAQ